MIAFLTMCRRSHIFDGKTQSTEIASFQLCDIQDPILVNLIESEEELRERCDVSCVLSTCYLSNQIFYSGT